VGAQRPRPSLLTLAVVLAFSEARDAYKYVQFRTLHDALFEHPIQVYPHSHILRQHGEYNDFLLSVLLGLHHQIRSTIETSLQSSKINIHSISAHAAPLSFL